MNRNPTLLTMVALGTMIPLIQSAGATPLVPPQGVQSVIAVADESNGFAVLPPFVGISQDPADSLYQKGREALSRGDYREAARMFTQILDEHEDSAYGPDAYYWRAFSLYRLGGGENLREAQESLEIQEEMYPEAATRGDAVALAVRISGALARRGDARAAERVTREAAGHAGCPQDPADYELKIAALNALLQMDEDHALPILLKILENRDECAAELRRRAVFMVSQQDSDEVTEILMGAARDDPDPEVRAQAVFWLSEVDSDESVDALEAVLMNAEDPLLQEKALFALGQHDSERSGQILRDFAMDTSNPIELRDRAVFWLGQRDEESVEFLKQLFERLDDDDLKERTLFAISQGGDEEENAAWLIDVALDGRHDMEIRKRALFWASQGEVPVDDLMRLYRQVEKPEMKEQIVFGLTQHDDEAAAVEALIEIARNDPDHELRSRAIFWLGQVDDDPRVVEFLGELLNQ